MAKQPPPKPKGRPARSGEASSNVTVRLTDSERAAYDDAATEREMTLGEWIRAACASFLKRRK